jgi:hypothetical protein
MSEKNCLAASLSLMAAAGSDRLIPRSRLMRSRRRTWQRCEWPRNAEKYFVSAGTAIRGCRFSAS